MPPHLARVATTSALLGFVEEQLENPDDFRRGVERLYQTPEAESFDVLIFRDGRMFERCSRPQRVDDKVTGRVWSFRDVTQRAHLLRRAVFLADASRLLAALDLRARAHRARPAGGAVDRRHLRDRSVLRRRAAAGGGGGAEGSRLTLDGVPQSVFNGHSTLEEGSPELIAVPIEMRGELLGALTLGISSPRHFSRPDLELAEELAGRTALSIDHDRSARQAEDALQVRDEFLNVAAHEIRLPVTSIDLALHKLRLLGKSAGLESVFEVLERADRRLERLVEELLETGAMKGSRFQFHYGEIDLGEVVRDVVRQLGTELARSGSTLSVRTEGALRGLWDRDRLTQVVENLIANAIKFGDRQPIEVAAVGNASHATLSVRDHGIGIAKPLQRKLFEPFGRAVSPHHYGGLGLGLFIVKKIVEALGGEIVRSRAARGTARSSAWSCRCAPPPACRRPSSTSRDAG